MESSHPSLADVPADFTVNYFKCSLSLRKNQKAQDFVSGYVETLNILIDDEKKNTCEVKCKRKSVKKSDS